MKQVVQRCQQNAVVLLHPAIERQHQLSMFAAQYPLARTA